MLLTAASFAVLPTLCHAQEPSTGKAPQVFEPSYFERFAPQTARDMILRIPGFSVRDTSDGRGLGQGGANVLINGERATSKGTSALDILSQTPASSVIRIEVTDAAALGVTGLTGQVANVVLSRDRLSGSWEWEAQGRRSLSPNFTNGSVSLSGTLSDVGFTIGFQNNSFLGGTRGKERVYDADRQLTDIRYEDAEANGERPSVTLSVEGGRKEVLRYNLAASAELFEFDGREISERSDGVVLESRNGEDEWNASGSVDLTRTIGPGDAKLIANHRFEHSLFYDRLRRLEGGQVVRLDSFDQTADETETILRGEYALARENGRSWEFAAEYAYNRLETESRAGFETIDEIETNMLDPVTVEEARYQTSLTHGGKLFGNLALQISGGAEYSEIQSATAGIEGEARSFFRPKGYLTATYPLGPKLELRSRVERSVGQLNFFAFVSSQNLREGVDQTGNVDLVPQQSWDGEVEVERRFGKGEKVILRATGSLIEDRVDQIVIDGEQATGNIDEARLFELEAEGTVLLERWGVEGGRIDFSGFRRWSELEDPIDGEDRPFSGTTKWNAGASYRHDIPNTALAYGGGVSHFENERGLTARQENLFSISRPQTELFVEHKDVLGMVATATLVNLLDQNERFDRTFYEGLRGRSDILFTEERSRDYKIIFVFSLSGTF
jgi:hypothetical protein